MRNFLTLFCRFESFFINSLRVAIFIVMFWIGGLKAFKYEAEGIVPFVANSPLMEFFYKDANNEIISENNQAIKEYTLHRNPEGKVIKENIEWHIKNGTYLFSYGLGVVIVFIGFAVLLGIWFPNIGFWGGLLTFFMSIVTLSFLITTPEVYVPNLGGDAPTPNFGFPYLSGAGRLVLKDIIMMFAGLVIATISAKTILLKSHDN